jgi:hypothetical protein
MKTISVGLEFTISLPVRRSRRLTRFRTSRSLIPHEYTPDLSRLRRIMIGPRQVFRGYGSGFSGLTARRSTKWSRAGLRWMIVSDLLGVIQGGAWFVLPRVLFQAPQFVRDANRSGTGCG